MRYGDGTRLHQAHHGTYAGTSTTAATASHPGSLKPITPPSTLAVSGATSTARGTASASHSSPNTPRSQGKEATTVEVSRTPCYQSSSQCPAPPSPERCSHPSPRTPAWIRGAMRSSNPMKERRRCRAQKATPLAALPLTPKEDHPALISPHLSPTRTEWANGWTKARIGWTARQKPQADPGHPAQSPRGAG